MLSEQNLLELTDVTIKRISQTVALLDIRSVETHPFELQNFDSLVVTTSSDYFLTIVFRADNCVLRAITRHMKRGIPDVAEDEIVIYTSEFFNILCGNIVTVINNSLHTSARFGIPKRIRGLYVDGFVPPRVTKRLSYESGYGQVEIQLFYPCPFLLAQAH